MGSPAPLPTPPQRQPILGAIDDLLFHGAFNGVQNQNFNRQLQTAQMQRMYAYGQSLPEDQRQAFFADPQGFLKVQEANRTLQPLKGGESLGSGAGIATTAPQIITDDKSGSIVSATPQGATPLGQFGGDFGAKDGLILSGRTGGVAGTYSQPQQVAPGATPGAFTPSINGAAPGFTQPGGPTPPPPSLPSLPASGGAPPIAAMRSNPQGFFSGLIGGPVRISSGYRSPQHNQAVHGSPTSEHLDNSAWDIVAPRGMTNADVVAKLQASGVPFDQIIDEGSHVHFGIGPKMRGQVLRTDGRGGYSPVATPTSQGAGPQAQTTNAAPGGWSLGAPQGSVRPATPQELAAANLPPGTSAQVVPGKGLEVLPGNYSDQDRKRVADLQDAYASSDQYANLANRFLEHNRTAGTGGIYSVPHVGEPLAEWDAKHNGDLASMEQLGTQMATALRSPGMRLTQMEFQKFGEVSPSVHNDGPTNATLAQNAQAAREYMRSKSEFYSGWLNQHGNLSGADAAWNAQQSAPQSSSHAAPQGQYHSADDVAQAYHSGKLSRDQAATILRSNGWAH